MAAHVPDQHPVIPGDCAELRIEHPVVDGRPVGEHHQRRALRPCQPVIISVLSASLWWIPAMPVDAFPSKW
jgi:hypothetical protein